MDSNNQLITTINSMLAAKKFEKYINSIRFPFFKNILEEEKVTLDFPLTILVGQNGVGKSSILHALYGAPNRYSTSDFWFSTKLDPIRNDNPARFIYEHWNKSLGKFVETRKARTGRTQDYWEPTKITSTDSMEAISKTINKKIGKGERIEGASSSLDRWTPVDRECIYVNMKAIYGAFDKFFYSEYGVTKKERKAIMINHASRVKKIADGGLESYILGGHKETVISNSLLGEREIKAISEILGRKYDSIRVIRHNLESGSHVIGWTVIFNQGSRQYSEVFAGSGEISAVRLVMEVLNAKEHSLVLIDEPETSMHPAAQEKIVRFLLEQIKYNKIQVVISTHSASIMKGLPNNAIKVLEDFNGKCRVIDSCSRHTALNRIGAAQEDKKTIYVEDDLAREIIIRAVECIDPAYNESIDVMVCPGGAESILCYKIPSILISSFKNSIFIYLDGDKKTKEVFTKKDDVSPSMDLGNILKIELNAKPKFYINGGAKGGDKAMERNAQLDCLDYISNNLKYLPKLCPEHLLLEKINPKLSATITSSESAKKELNSALTNNQASSYNSAQLFGLQKREVKLLQLDFHPLREVADQIRAWLKI